MRLSRNQPPLVGQNPFRDKIKIPEDFEHKPEYVRLKDTHLGL
jgi:hypothetical protein